MTPHKSFDQIFAEGSVIQVAGQQRKLAKLSNADMAEFISARKNAQLATFYETMHKVPAARQSEIIGRIICDAWSDFHIVQEAATVPGASWLIERSLKNAGDSGSSADIEHAELMDKATYVLVLSGLLSPDALKRIADEAGGEDANPPVDGQITGEQSSQM